MSIYRAVVTALAEADSAADFERVAEQVLRIISTPAGLLDLTRRAVREINGTHPVAYMHSNGFLKIEYMRSRPLGIRVRGHFWNPAWGVIRQNPHNHSFDFRSRVVVGTFDHRHFARMAEGEGRFHFGYRYSRAMRSGVDQYSLEKTAPAWLQEREGQQVAPGAEYLMGCEQLHALDPIENGFGATAVVSRPNDIQPWSEVYSVNEGLDRTPRNAKLLEPETMIECVESVLAVGSR